MPSTAPWRSRPLSIVVIVQRFGSALNLNVHLHAMVMDGVFARDERGDVHFHAARHPTPPDLTPLLVTLARRIGRVLARHGMSDGADGLDVADPWVEEAPTLAGLAAASVRGVAAIRSWRRSRRPHVSGTRGCRASICTRESRYGPARASV